MRLFRKKTPLPGPPAPEVAFTAIGDIHGRSDLLRRAFAAARGQIVCLGDYVDRGPNSAEVLRLLQGRGDVVCLMGNHEEMMLDFLDDPEAHGPRWLRNGGVQTVESFGVSYDGSAPLVRTRDALRQKMGPALEAWLRALPSFWVSGNLAVVHAAADPTRALDDQGTRALRWGHKLFGKTRRQDGLWILRGHVVVDEPIADETQGIISIDTGAYATDRLTLAHVSAQGVEFSQA